MSDHDRRYTVRLMADHPVRLLKAERRMDEATAMDEAGNWVADLEPGQSVVITRDA